MININITKNKRDRLSLKLYFIMKLQFRALFLFSILVALFGCHNKIEEELSKLLKHKIIIPYDQMPDTYSTAILEINKNAKYRLVVFVDSTECSSCSLRSLAEWETYIGEKAHKNLNLHIILQPKANEYNEISTDAIKSHCY